MGVQCLLQIYFGKNMPDVSRLPVEDILIKNLNTYLASNNYSIHAVTGSWNANKALNLNMSEFLPIETSGSQGLIRNLTMESSAWITFDLLTKQNSSDPLKPRPISAHVNNTYARLTRTDSRIQISRDFMITVIVFNAVKLAIMIWVLLKDKNDYLVTLGDAIASFLEHPDATTKGMCMLGKEEMLFMRGVIPYHTKEEQEILIVDLQNRAEGKWRPQKLRYMSGLGTDRQMIFAFLYVLSFLT